LVNRLALVSLLVLASLLAGCGASTPKGPPELLFVSTMDGDYAIFGADADGGHVRRVSKDDPDPSTPQGLFHQLEPAWSPDGARIAFVSRRDGHAHVFVVSTDGTSWRRLTSSSKDDAHPAWSPDGRHIVFSREGALFGISVSGGTARRVGRGVGSALNPAWSPDGTRIAYDYRTPGSEVREVYVMNADGTGTHRLTKLGAVSAFPAWSPDGSRIAFQSNLRLEHPEIYTTSARGGGVRKETGGSTDAIQPAWSPGGGLSFIRDGAVWLMTGGEEKRLTSEDDNASSPAWRPVTAK
jgi:TolB protein